MNKIKLVIWDLDETFWDGTLSEGEIIPVEKNIQIVKELTSRGIMNSICSKNDFETAKSKLESLEIWDHFIFPQIDWLPKGEMVKEILLNCQLRADNTLFLDDNFLNLEEVKFYNPAIYAELPLFCESILTLEAFKGKPDPDYQKLEDYKLLEKKAGFKKAFSSNLDFLNQSEIKISFIENLEGYEDRVAELIEKTNQLNFTKKRISKTEVEILLKDTSYNNFCIHVEDRYGIYGLVGFVSVNTQLNKLEHFIFSCRIMNLGIEQYVYAKLNFPDIEIIGDVSSILNKTEYSNWIQEIRYIERDNIRNLETSKIFFKGGCDLSQLFTSFQSLNLEILEEANYVSSGNFPIHKEHTENILNSIRLTNSEKENLIQMLPFVDNRFYQTKLFEEEFKVIVFSPLMDYTQEVFELKSNPQVTVTWGGHHETLSNPKMWTKLGQWAKRKGINSMDNEFFTMFSDHFQSRGQITPDLFLQNLNCIVDNLKGNPKIILINGAEIEHPSNDDDKDKAILRHKLMNAAIDNFVKNSDHVYLLDVRKFVKSNADLVDSIRHYVPKVYRDLATELKNILEIIFHQSLQIDLDKKQSISNVKTLRKFLFRIKKKNY